MSFQDNYLGCPGGVAELRALSDELNTKVLNTVNNTQELVMINDFAKDANEYQFKKCLQDRISDIYSWRWVLEDLSKRLDDAIAALNYELKALKIVGVRVQKEVDDHYIERTRPATLCLLSDPVEEAIDEEYKFLNQQKKNFEGLIMTLQKQIANLTKTNKRILKDILMKSQTIAIEESCASRNTSNIDNVHIITKRKKGSPPKRWQNRCLSLKKDGLQGLCHAVVARQQVRGARVQLSIMSEAHMSKVDAALKRRLHANQSKFAELEWQKEEAQNDLRSLEEEMLNTEQTLIQNMEQERVVKARLADRFTRPPGELLKDEVNIKLKDELIRIKQFIRDLRKNIEEISALQIKVKDSLMRIGCAQNDLFQIINLDETRKAARMGEDTSNTEAQNWSHIQPMPPFTPPTCGPCNSTSASMEPVCTAADLPPEARCSVLLTIREEEEDNGNECGACGNNPCVNDCSQPEDSNNCGYGDDDDEDQDDYPFDF